MVILDDGDGKGEYVWRSAALYAGIERIVVSKFDSNGSAHLLQNIEPGDNFQWTELDEGELDFVSGEVVSVEERNPDNQAGALDAEPCTTLHGD